MNLHFNKLPHLAVLGLGWCWLSYQMPTSSVGQPAIYRFLLCNVSWSLTKPFRSARSDMISPWLHLDFGAHIEEWIPYPSPLQLKPHGSLDGLVLWRAKPAMEATIQAKSLDKNLKITLAGLLYLVSPWSLLNEVCVFIQIPSSQGSFRVGGKIIPARLSIRMWCFDIGLLHWNSGLIWLRITTPGGSWVKQ